jgi:hypothetical protein
VRGLRVVAARRVQFDDQGTVPERLDEPFACGRLRGARVNQALQQIDGGGF